VRITPRPTDHGALGHYRVAQTVSLVAVQTTTGSLFTFRWTDTTRLAVITKLRLEFLQTANATAALFPLWQAFIARSFTGADTLGTTVTITGNNMKKRTNMGTTLVQEIRYANTSAGLAAGTRTLDANPVFELPCHIMTTISTTGLGMTTYRKDLDIDVGDGIHPIVLGTSEGLVIKGNTNFGAAGTGTLSVDLSWMEVTAY
jgi:hypothetical protein